MNSRQWSSPQHRLSCAAAAVLASTLVLSSVLWLFARVDIASAAVPIAAAKHQPSGPTGQRAARRLAAPTASVARL